MIAPANLVTLGTNEEFFSECSHQYTPVYDFRKQSLLCQLKKNSDVCTTRLGCTNVLTHKIYLSHDVPIKQKPYRVSPAKPQLIKEHVDDMLEKDIIEPSTPVDLVPKKNDPKLCFCVDFRKLNASTHTDAYALPNIQEILESLSRVVVFTTLDMNNS